MDEEFDLARNEYSHDKNSFLRRVNQEQTALDNNGSGPSPLEGGGS
jgi:hypothetical protein